MSDRVGLLEGVQELVENVLLSLLTRDDVWVFFCVVTATDVIQVEHTAAVAVNHSKCLLYEGFSASVHRTHDLSQEFVIDNLAVLVRVKSVKDGLDLHVIVRDAIALEGLGKLSVVKSTRSVIIHNLERLAEVENAARTSFLDACPDSLNQIFVGDELGAGVLLGGATSIPFSLHIDTLVLREVEGLASTCCRHGVVDGLSLLGWPCMLVLHSVCDKLVIGLAVEDLVVFVFPLFTGVLSADIWV